MIYIYVNKLQYFQKYFCYHFHSQKLSLFLRWSYCRWTWQQWILLPSASTTQYGFHRKWKPITRCISPMSFGIIFEVFGDKKLEVRWLLSWYVIVWTFVRTWCSLGHCKKRWKRLISWYMCLGMTILWTYSCLYMYNNATAVFRGKL